MKEMKRGQGGLVGQIRPAPDGGAPVFRVLHRRDDPRLQNLTDNAGVRACEHSRHTFILDEKYATVTCGGCKERVDAFAVLLVFAEWTDRWRSDRLLAERAEKQLYVSRLRQLAKLRSLTEAQRAEIVAFLREEYRHSITDAKKLCSRMEEVVVENRNARRKAQEGRA